MGRYYYFLYVFRSFLRGLGRFLAGFGRFWGSIELKNIDRIWHLASPASPTKYQINPIETSKINFIGSINALNLAKENKAKILLTSSSECYGHSKQFPQKESEGGFLSTSSKRSCYSQSKRIAETLFFDYERVYDLDVKVTRLFNIYGPNMDM